jgi:hypothetical protein
MPFMVSMSNSAIASIIEAMSWRLPDSVIRWRASSVRTMPPRSATDSSTRRI